MLVADVRYTSQVLQTQPLLSLPDASLLQLLNMTNLHTNIAIVINLENLHKTCKRILTPSMDKIVNKLEAFTC